jgi:hypothetical protein
MLGRDVAARRSKRALGASLSLDVVEADEEVAKMVPRGRRTGRRRAILFISLCMSLLVAFVVLPSFRGQGTMWKHKTSLQNRILDNQLLDKFGSSVHRQADEALAQVACLHDLACSMSPRAHTYTTRCASVQAFYMKEHIAKYADTHSWGNM